MDLLSVNELRVSYGLTEVVHGISFSIGEREVITMIGANGAGKSSTLRAISGLNQQKSGSIVFREKEISDITTDKIFRMGIVHVPEGRHVFPYMTVLENLYCGSLNRKDRKGVKDELVSVYDRFPILKSRSRQNAGTLSGGEQQMLSIGRALMAGPKLLLLDEPSLGLAPTLVKEIGVIIRNINETQGVPIVLVEQNALMALNIASRAYVIETGAIVYSGASKDVLKEKELKRYYLGR